MYKRLLLISLGVLAVALVCSQWLFPFASSAGQAPSEAQQKREQLYRLNNQGIAFMEQYKHEDAVKKFKEALATDANFALARTNLALALFYLNDSRAAVEEARAAVKLVPNSPTAHYVLGASLRNEKLYDEALAEFNQVLKLDPQDPATNILIGQIYSQKQQYNDAIVAFRRALDAESFNATAAYSLAQAQIRAGQAAEGQKMLAKFQQLRASGYATTLGQVYGEKGRYGEAVVSTGAEAELVSPDGVKVSFGENKPGLSVTTAAKPLHTALNRKLNKAEFNDQTKRELIAPFSNNLALADFNNDNKLDLFVSGVTADGKPFVKFLQNDGGKFPDVTDKTKITANNFISGAVFGDFDNDNKTDAALFGYQTLTLWRNNGDGSFSDVTAKAGLNNSAWTLTAAWVDADHDGDLDLFAGNFADLSQWPGNSDAATFPDDFAGADNKLFRNNGDGSFTDITTQAGLAGGKLKTTAVVCTDFNNQRDIDFLVVNYGAPVQLFSNQRDGSFKEIAATVGLSFNGKALSGGAGDLNKDNFVDFYLPGWDGKGALFLSNGRGGFAPVTGNEQASAAAQFADYDNDGLLDVITSGQDAVALRRGLGNKLADATSLPATKSEWARAFAVGDLNEDGGVDVVTFKSNGELAIWQNNGFGKNYARLLLAGKTSNRSAVGTKVELRSGSLRQKLEVYASSPAPAAASLNLGLGYRTQIDALSLFWPAGILQSESAVKASAENQIEELDRKGTSCPLLYAWNGKGYNFVTDFLGGSAIGYLLAPGTYNYPDTDEYIRVTSEQLQERDGFLSLRMNNQLEEVIFFDQAKLLAVDHPADIEIYPNERLMPGPPYPEFKTFAVKQPRPPISAVDERGQDILPLLKDIDRRYPEDFAKLPFKGYAREHAITLDLGDLRNAKRVLLLMTAWIDYADSTSNLAASQAGVKLVPPYVQVKNAAGEWQTVVPQMGFPAGLPKTMTVDLTGKFLCQDARVRIVTSMRIYWDQILLDTFDGVTPSKVSQLSPARAELRWRGFPREYSPDGRKPLIYDYSVIESCAPWKAHLGNYTRFGDVRALLLQRDDRYVITRNGDEIQLDFDARRLPVLPAGWKRTYLVFADGFGKDMDINSARPETIGELPFHGMKSYPYAPTDRYPQTKRHQDYLRQYNTRTVNQQTQASWQGVK